MAISPRSRVRAAAMMAAAFLVGAVPGAAQVPGVQLSAAQTKQTVEAIAKDLADEYVFVDRARMIANHLRRRLKAGAYAGLAPEELAARLTEDLRSAGRDRHLEVVADRQSIPGSARASPPASERYGWIDRLRNRNYDFYRVERMPGNVGYLDLRSFPPPDVAGPTAKAAMTFLRNSRAVIVDLRHNGGGAGTMVQLLASHFFPEQVRLLRTFRRADNPQVTDDRTLPFLEAERLAQVPVFVLVSNETFSAAEAFAFALQERGRATIVGEVTKGGANAGRYVAAPNGLRVFIPVAHAMSPLSDKSWDDTGVVPDVKVPAPDALAAAHRLALKGVLDRSTDPEERKVVETLLGEVAK